MLFVINYISVFIYGVLIMAFFLHIKMNKKNMIYMLGYVMIGGFLQMLLSVRYGPKLVEELYPLVIHMPLLFFFSVVFKRKVNVVLFALMTSYIFTAPRRWIGEFVASFLNNDPYVALIFKILASILLLFIIYKFLRPVVNRILKFSSTRITLLSVVPVSSYVITYATTVYTDALYHSNMLVVGLFSIGFNFIFYAFLIAYFSEMDKNYASKTEQTILKMQMETTILQIEDYKEAQMQGAVYRHDLRHHLHYLSDCITENHTEEALEYIKQIDKNVGKTHVKSYCKNTSVNLILSAYVTKAQKKKIDISIEASVPKISSIEVIDVCVILSNGIENAIHACSKMKKKCDRKIYVSCNFENKKKKIEISNNFEGEISFEEDVPITNEENHGLGVKSIIATVKKYHGLYSFTKDNNVFTIRIIL